MARTRDDDYDDEQGFARLDDAGSDDDEDGARRAPAVEAPAGAEVAELRAQVATLTGQVERLRAGATLEARRSEPATVGDVVDAVHAELAGREAQLAALAVQQRAALADEVAACVEERLLGELVELRHGRDDDDGGGGAAKGRGGGKSPHDREVVVLKRAQGYIDADGRLRVARGGEPLPAGARTLDR